MKLIVFCRTILSWMPQYPRRKHDGQALVTVLGRVAG